MKRIVIEMEGGLVQEVHTDFQANDIEVLVLDHDNMDTPEEELSQVEGINEKVYLIEKQISKDPAFVEAAFEAFLKDENRIEYDGPTLPGGVLVLESDTFESNIDRILPR